MTYFIEFTTFLLMLLACLRIVQALSTKHIGAAALHVFAGGFYGTIAVIGMQLLNFGGLT